MAKPGMEVKDPIDGEVCTFKQLSEKYGKNQATFANRHREGTLEERLRYFLKTGKPLKISTRGRAESSPKWDFSDMRTRKNISDLPSLTKFERDNYKKSPVHPDFQPCGI